MSLEQDAAKELRAFMGQFRSLAKVAEDLEALGELKDINDRLQASRLANKDVIDKSAKARLDAEAFKNHFSEATAHLVSAREKALAEVEAEHKKRMDHMTTNAQEALNSFDAALVKVQKELAEVKAEKETVSASLAKVRATLEEVTARVA